METILSVIVVVLVVVFIFMPMLVSRGNYLQHVKDGLALLIVVAGFILVGSVVAFGVNMSIDFIFGDNEMMKAILDKINNI